MIARFLRRLFPPTSPKYDPDADDNVTYFREQKRASEKEIQQANRRRTSVSRNAAQFRGQPASIADALRQIRPMWEDARDEGSR